MATLFKTQHSAPVPKTSPTFAALSGFDGISLGELDHSDARLLERRERKFLMTLGQCTELITGLSGSYRVLEIDRSRMGRYETIYYDTDTFLTYLQHHNGKGNRFKVRFRHYFSSDETYLEIKEKRNTGRTVKKRMETDRDASISARGPKKFLTSVLPLDSNDLHPVLATEYTRITLVSQDLRERITFDSYLTFRNQTEEVSYPGIVIGEIKYERSLMMTPVIAALKKLGIRDTSFSKYCIGVSLLYSEQKHNGFKPQRMLLEKLSNRGSLAC